MYCELLFNCWNLPSSFVDLDLRHTTLYSKERNMVTEQTIWAAQLGPCQSQVTSLDPSISLHICRTGRSAGLLVLVWLLWRVLVSVINWKLYMLIRHPVYQFSTAALKNLVQVFIGNTETLKEEISAKSKEVRGGFRSLRAVGSLWALSINSTYTMSAGSRALLKTPWHL